MGRHIALDLRFVGDGGTTRSLRTSISYPAGAAACEGFLELCELRGYRDVAEHRDRGLEFRRGERLADGGRCEVSQFQRFHDDGQNQTLRPPVPSICSSPSIPVSAMPRTPYVDDANNAVRRAHDHPPEA